jgi:uroporphyrinogen decarboxylase
MDSRTRVMNAIQRKPLDRIPRYDAFWEDTLTAWRQQGLPANVEAQDYFDFDIRMMFIDTSMRCEQRVLSQDADYITYQDRYGYTVKKAIGKSRSIGFSDHATKDRTAWQHLRPRFIFNPQDMSRLDAASYFMHMAPYPAWSEVQPAYGRLRQTGRYLCFCAYGPWEGTWRHRGYTELLMDLIEDPAWAQDMAETHNDLLIASLQHAIELNLKPDALFIVDDLACTRGLLFSRECWRTIFKPAYRKLGAFLRQHDISFWLHSCGNCEALLADFIDCGLQVIQPLQASAGMDVRRLKGIYGADLTFWGNIDVTAMSGPARLCEAEIRDKILCAREGSGYMYHSDHSIPPEVELERYRWVMELVRRYGTY